MRFAVAGGTGWIGRLVVEEAGAAGHDTVVIARSAGVDVIAGTGLDIALTGVEAVIDVTNRTRGAGPFFETATRNLLAAETRTGVGHHVLLSIVGIDRLRLGYYRAKLRQEELVQAGPVPWTILRATQFYEFAAQMLDQMAAGPFVLGPSTLTQPVAAREVAQELVRLAAAGPQGRVPDIAGPAPLRMAALVRAVARSRPRRRFVVPVPAGVGDRLLPRGAVREGKIRFDEWLRSPDGRRER